MNDKENLTDQIEVWLDTVRVPEQVVLKPLPQVRVLRRREEKELAAKARKRRSLRHRKRYTRKPGTVHPKKKEATARRKYARRWQKEPFSCLITGWGCWNLDRKLWDKHCQPLWERYDPADLQVKKYPRPYGTRVKPYDVYGFDVVHKSLGTLYCGSSQEIYDLSSSSL
jgi:hypothetical protein